MKLDGLAIDGDLARVWAVKAGQDARESRLAGSVLTQQSVNLAMPGFKVDGVVGEDAGEALGDRTHGHRRDFPGGDLIVRFRQLPFGLPMTPWTNQSIVRIWSRVILVPFAILTAPDWSFSGPVNS